ncbi:MAG: sulfatase [Gemmatimonadales bacterium]
MTAPGTVAAPGSRPRAGAADLALLAIFAGLVGGWLDVLSLALRRVLVEPLVFVGHQVGWTAPLAVVALYLGVALGVGLLSRLVPRVPGWRLGLWTMAFLSVFGMLYNFPQVHRLAALVLSAGVATVTTRTLAAREPRVRQWLRRAAPATLLVWAVWAGGSLVRDAWRERRAGAALPAARAGAPNVLLIVLDTVRAMSLSLYGYARQTTPELERWSARGVTFDNAYATAPWTLPSHASLLTGRWMHELSADWMVPLDATYPTLSEFLAAAGYRTGGFVANTDYCSAEVGLDRGFSRYEDYVLTPGQILRSSALWRAISRIETLRRLIGNYDNLGRKMAPDINRAFLRWADADPRPFFAMLNYYDAHRPYLPPDPWPDRFRTDDVSLNVRYRKENGNEPNPTPARVQGAVDAYDGAIAYLDSEIGRLLAELESRGLLENTIVVITADHGEELFEHEIWDHGNTLYDPSVHVPLLILAPGLPTAARVGTPVSLREVPATVVDLLRLADSPFPGRSLARWWDEGMAPPVPDTVFTGVRKVPRQPFWYPVSQGDVIGVQTGPLRYLRNLGDGTEQLFDHRTDRAELSDLAADTAWRARLEPLRRASIGLFPERP